MTLPVRVRDWVESDRAFIMDSWRRSFAEYSDLYKLDPLCYSRWMRLVIGRRLREVGAIVRMACDPDDENTVVGFAAVTGPELHYVYVRGGKETSLRGHGIVPAMLDGLDIRTYSFRTEAGERRLKPQQRGWSFAPRSNA